MSLNLAVAAKSLLGHRRSCAMITAFPAKITKALEVTLTESVRKILEEEEQMARDETIEKPYTVSDDGRFKLYTLFNKPYAVMKPHASLDYANLVMHFHPEDYQLARLQFTGSCSVVVSPLHYLAKEAVKAIPPFPLPKLNVVCKLTALRHLDTNSIDDNEEYEQLLGKHYPVSMHEEMRSKRKQGYEDCKRAFLARFPEAGEFLRREDPLMKGFVCLQVDDMTYFGADSRDATPVRAMAYNDAAADSVYLDSKRIIHGINTHGIDHLKVFASMSEKKQCMHAFLFQVDSLGFNLMCWFAEDGAWQEVRVVFEHPVSRSDAAERMMHEAFVEAKKQWAPAPRRS